MGAHSGFASVTSPHPSLVVAEKGVELGLPVHDVACLPLVELLLPLLLHFPDVRYAREQRKIKIKYN